MEWLDEEVRVMRIAWADVGDVVDGPERPEEKVWVERDHTILSVLRNMAEGWEKTAGPGQACVREGGGDCVLFSTDEVDDEPVKHIQMPPQRLKKTDDIYRGVVIPFRIAGGAMLDFERRWAAEMAALSGKAQGEVYEESRMTGRGADNTGTWLLTVSYSRLCKLTSSSNQNHFHLHIHLRLSLPYLRHRPNSSIFFT